MGTFDRLSVYLIHDAISLGSLGFLRLSQAKNDALQIAIEEFSVGGAKPCRGCAELVLKGLGIYF